MGELARSLGKLDLTIGDLSNWQSWAKPPDETLLAVVRQNSPLAVWLEALSLDPPADSGRPFRL
jgi:hypothetical protein